MDKKQTIYDFLHTQTHAVISTIDKDGNPEAALIGFGEDKDLTLVFGTDTTTRKYQNLLNNPKVALVIGLGKELITTQYEGRTTPLEGDELIKYKNLYHTKTPDAKKYDSYPNQIYFKITPVWIRYGDYNKEPEELFEITL